MAKQEIGLIEKVKVIGKNKSREVQAKFDTGAKRSSIDKKLAKEIGVGKLIRYAEIKSASVGKKGFSRRPVHPVKIRIKGKTFDVNVNISDRSHLNQKVLIGRDVIFKNFKINIEKSHNSMDIKDIKEGYL